MYQLISHLTTQKYGIFGKFLLEYYTRRAKSLRSVTIALFSRMITTAGGRREWGKSVTHCKTQVHVQQRGLKTEILLRNHNIATEGSSLVDKSSNFLSF